jgi:hypothetical protein
MMVFAQGAAVSFGPPGFYFNVASPPRKSLYRHWCLRELPAGRKISYDDHYGSGYGQAEEAILFGSHPALEIIDWVDSVPDRVPILRVKPFVVSRERHPEADFLKSVWIRTLSKNVKSSDVAKGYEELLEEEGVRWNENNHGTVSYHCLHGYLELIVTEGSELPRVPAESLRELFQYPALQFPPPRIVEGVHEAMRAVFDDRLDFYGKPQRKTPDKLIPAFAAWHVGGKVDEQVPPAERPRVSKILNRHLLEPCSLPQLPESSWTSNDTVWADVRVLLPRFINIQQYAFYSSHRF